MIKNSVRKKISLVVPVYNEQLELSEVLTKYVMDLKNIVKNRPSTSYEVVVVNDGSNDDSTKILAEAARLNRNIRVINFDARYGKQAAITAGMAKATGDCVVLADIDVLNPFGVIEFIVNEYLEGHEIVYAYRERNGWDAFANGVSEGFVKFASGLYGVRGRYTGRPRVMLYSRNIVDVLNTLPEKNKVMRTMDAWIGYNIKNLMFSSEYDRREEKQKLREAKQQYIDRGGDVVQRNKVREHTSSMVYATTLLSLTFAMMLLGILFPIFLQMEFVHIFFWWLITTMVGFLSVALLARAAIIKRVGLIHKKDVVEIYNIKNTIN